MVRIPPFANSCGPVVPRLVAFLAAAFVMPAAADVTLSEATYEGRPHFVVSADHATAWLDRQSGGLSRLVDPDGRDWIAFRMQPWGDYPPAAAGAFRGLPNLVFKDEYPVGPDTGDDGGFGHPGWDRAETRVVSREPAAVVLESRALSGRWTLRWTFTAEAARFEITKAPDGVRYWVLYEGPPAGRFAPARQTLHTASESIASADFDFFAGQKWTGTAPAYAVTDAAAETVLIIRRLGEGGGEGDSFGALGNTAAGLDSQDGMFVLGIGRGPDGIDPRLSGPQSFEVRLQSIPAAATDRDASVRVLLRAASP